MSLALYDDSLQNEVSSPVTGTRYVLLRSYTTAPVNCDFSSEGAQLVSPPSVPLPGNGRWNPSGDANPPSWMLPISDGYAIVFTSTGSVQVSVGAESGSYTVAAGPQQPPDEEKFSVRVLQWDAAWLHTVFVCELSYSGSSDVVVLRACDVGTDNIYAVDVESDGTYEFWCEYDDASGDAIVHISPAPTSAISVRAVIIGDTR